MMKSVLALPLLAMVALAILAVIIAIIILLVNRRTRVATAIVLLASPIVLAVLVPFFCVGMSHVPSPAPGQLTFLGPQEGMWSQQSIVGQQQAMAPNRRHCSSNAWRPRRPCARQEALRQNIMEQRRTIPVQQVEVVSAQDMAMKAERSKVDLATALVSALVGAVKELAADNGKVFPQCSQPPAPSAVALRSVAEKTAKDGEKEGVGPPAKVVAFSQMEKGSDNAGRPQAEAVADKATTRPAWIDVPPQVVGDAYQMSVVVGPYTTRQECDAKLPEALQEALDRYVETAIGPNAVRVTHLPIEELRHEMVIHQWEETRQYSVGPMIRLHVRLQFDARVKGRVLDAYRQAIVAQRLRSVATWAALGLTLLAVCFAYLKIDLATAGAHRNGLRWGAAAAILGLGALALVIVA